MTTCSLGNIYHWPVGMVCQGRCGTLQPISSPPITQVWISTKCPLGTFSMLLFLRISNYRWSSMAIRIGGHVISSIVWASVIVIVVFRSWKMSSWLCWFNYCKVTNESLGLSLYKLWPSFGYYSRAAFMYTYRIESIDNVTDVHLQHLVFFIFIQPCMAYIRGRLLFEGGFYWQHGKWSCLAGRACDPETKSHDPKTKSPFQWVTPLSNSCLWIPGKLNMQSLMEAFLPFGICLLWSIVRTLISLMDVVCNDQVQLGYHIELCTSGIRRCFWAGGCAKHTQG